MNRLSVEVSALIEFNGRAVMMPHGDGYRLPTRSVASSVDDTLKALMAELGLMPARALSIRYEDRQNNKQHIVLLCAADRAGK